MAQDPSSEKNVGGAVKQMALAFQMPFMIVGPVILGGVIGYFLDRWLHTKPLLLIVLGILGIVVGLRDVLKAATAQDKN